MNFRSSLRLGMAVLMVLSFGLAGCQPGFQPVKYVSLDSSLDMDTGDLGKDLNLGLSIQDESEINEALDKAYLAIADVEALDLGLINETQLNALKDLLDSSFGKLIEKMDEAREKLDEVKAKLEAQLQNLDPSLPNYQDLVAKIRDAMDKISDFQDQISGAMVNVVDKIDLITDLLERLQGRLNPSNILQLIIIALIERIKDKVSDYKSELLARI